MEDVAILGVGLHPWGKFPEKPWAQMVVEAAREALGDAGVEWTDVQTVISGSQLWGGRKGIYSGNYFAEAMGGTGVPVININNACATGGVLMNVATSTIASGRADIVLAVAADKSAKGFFPYLPVYHDEPIPSNDTLRWNMGLPNPVYWAFEMRKRMIKYGDTEEHLAKIKVLCSKHGSLNPKARYKKVFTLEEVLNSAMVTDPLRLLEICATSDGAAAIVFGSMKAAKKYSTKPITIAATAIGTPLYGDPTTSIPVVSFNPKPGVPLISEVPGTFYSTSKHWVSVKKVKLTLCSTEAILRLEVKFPYVPAAVSQVLARLQWLRDFAKYMKWFNS
jgi:acetyl-CoA acetyltransferase